MQKTIIISIAVIVLGGVIIISIWNKKDTTINNTENNTEAKTTIEQINQSIVTNKSMELDIKTIQVGTGERKTKNGDTISVHYAGKLENGVKFDSSVDRGTPFEFTIGQGMVIQGWEKGLLDMKVGEKRTLTIPADMGYGSRGAGGVIPPNATLIFEVELVAIK